MKCVVPKCKLEATYNHPDDWCTVHWNMWFKTDPRKGKVPNWFPDIDKKTGKVTRRGRNQS